MAAAAQNRPTYAAAAAKAKTFVDIEQRRLKALQEEVEKVRAELTRATAEEVQIQRDCVALVSHTCKAMFNSIDSKRVFTVWSKLTRHERKLRSGEVTAQRLVMKKLRLLDKGTFAGGLDSNRCCLDRGFHGWMLFVMLAPKSKSASNSKDGSGNLSKAKVRLVDTRLEREAVEEQTEIYRSKGDQLDLALTQSREVGGLLTNKLLREHEALVGEVVQLRLIYSAISDCMRSLRTSSGRLNARSMGLVLRRIDLPVRDVPKSPVVTSSCDGAQLSQGPAAPAGYPCDPSSSAAVRIPWPPQQPSSTASCAHVQSEENPIMTSAPVLGDVWPNAAASYPPRTLQRSSGTHSPISWLPLAKGTRQDRDARTAARAFC